MPTISRASLVAPDHRLTVGRFTGYAISLEAKARRVERALAFHGMLSAAPLRKADALRSRAAAWRHAASVVRTLHLAPAAERPCEEWTAPVARVARNSR